MAEFEGLPEMVALETECLRAGAWPKPNAKLNSLLQWLPKFGLAVVVPDAALRERENQLRRDTEKMHLEAEACLRRAKALSGAKGDLTLPVAASLVAARVAESREAAKAFNLDILPMSERPLADVFEFALAEVPPFEAKGLGFKDTVILLSVVEEAQRRGIKKVWLVSADQDFQSSESICGEVQVRQLSIDAASDALQNADHELMQTRLAEMVDLAVERKRLAGEALKAAGRQIADEATNDLDIPLSVVGYGMTDRVESLSFDEVSRVISVEPLFEDVPPGQRVTFAAEVRLSANVLSTYSYTPLIESTVRVGQPAGTAKGRETMAALVRPDLLKATVKPLDVLVNGSLRRSENGYDDLAVEDLDLKSRSGPILTALLDLPTS